MVSAWNDKGRVQLSVIGFCAIAALGLALSGGSGTIGALAAKPNKPDDKPDKPEKVSSGPNIITIVTDDQTLESLREDTMPNVLQEIGGEGTTFTNAIATTPLCCPSRATFITGQYTHNHRVFANAPGYATLVDKRNVLPAWLQRAGYVTAHVGKYLNRYAKAVQPDSEVAPGWDEWVAALEPRAYFDYKLQVNGRTVDYGQDDSDYLTRVINWRALKIIRKYVREPRPLYLQIDHFAPHRRGAGDPAQRCAGGAIPDPLDNTLFDGAPPPQTPNFNEKDVSDKPTYIQNLPEITEEEQQEIGRRYGCALASLVAVDRGVSQIFAQLRRLGELRNTVIMFTSDNGFFHGEHRIQAEKTIPYEEALRVPLIFRVPKSVLGGQQVASVDSLVGNIDIAPTILDLANAQPCIGKKGGCRVMDGRSLLDLMRGDSSAFQDRHLAIEQGVCGYRGVRNLTEIALEHLGERIEGTEQCAPEREYEIYDLVEDPYELTNLYPANNPAEAQTESRLFGKLQVLGDCAGIEGRDPVPLSGHYCE
jgi:N-acetylglucosamine-6-sulfatase